MTTGAVSIDVMARIEVPRDTYVEEVRRLARGGRQRAGEAILTLAGGTFRIAAGGGEVRLPAKGRWPGEARTSFSWLLAMAKLPPAMDPLVFEVFEGRLRIGGSSIVCHWQRHGAAAIELPANAGWTDLLRAGLLHDDTALEQSGLLKQVEQARRKAALVLRRAYPALNEFGVTMLDLEQLVAQALLRR